VQSREEHRREKVKPLQVATRENGVQATRSVFEDGCAPSSIPPNNEGYGQGGIFHQLHPCAICSALGQLGAQPAGQEEGPTAAECPRGQDLATSHKIL